jgi:hypothetical protein
VALAAGLGAGALLMSRGGGAQGPEAEERYREAIQGAVLCIGGGDVARARQLLAGCPQALRGWEWHYLNSVGSGAAGLPAIHLTATADAMGFSAESDAGAAPPPPDMLKTSAILEAMRAAAEPSGSVTGPRDLAVTDLGTPEPMLKKDDALIAPLGGHSEAVLCAAFTPDARRVATASADGTIRIWSVATGADLLTLPGLRDPRRLWFSPDGSLLFLAAEGRALVYVARPWSGVAAPQ